MSTFSRFLPALRDGAQAPEASRRSETGDTLIEVLLAIVIIGISAVSLLAGFATSISASAEHRSLTTLDTILRSYVESATYQIQQQASPLFASCATTYSPTFTIPTGDPGYAVGISSVSYWNGTAFTSSCPAGSTAPQQITASATGPSNTSDSLNFIVVEPAFQSPVGTPTQLVVTTEPPSSSTSGVHFAVAVSVEDTLGNVVTAASSPILLAIASNPNAGMLTCAANPVTPSNGVSVFSCSIDMAGSGYTLTASNSTFSSVVTSPFAITAGPVSRLILVSPPISGSASASAGLGPITVQEQDAAGNPTTAAETVALASTSAGAKFASTLNGVAITALSIPNGSSSATFYYGDTTAGSPTITASSFGLSPGTQNEIISAAAAVKLAFNPSSPSPGTAGSSIANVVVQVQDSFGNVVTNANSGTVALTIAAGGPQTAFTSGTTSRNVSSGVASFTGLVVNTPGSYVLTATPSGIGGVTAAVNSAAFSVSPGAATQLVISAQPPATATAGTNVTVAATLKDALGNVATTSSGPISLAISNNPGAGTLSCATNPVTATAGVATFSCSINKAATGYTLVASASGASSATTGPMTITAGAGTQLVLTSTPFGATASSSPTTAFTTTLEDAYGNAATNGTATTVTLSSTSTGTKEFAATSGGATVTSVSLPANTASVTAFYGDTKAGSPVITVAATGLTSGTQTETVLPGAASKWVFTSSALSGTANSSPTIGPIVVQEQDSLGNPTMTAETLSVASNSAGTNEFSLTSGATTFFTTVSIPAGSTSATFFYGDTKSGGPTLTASGSSLTGATQVETITPGAGTKLALTSAAFSTLFSSSATTAFTTTLEDAYGNPTTTASAITVNLSSTSSGKKFAASSGGASVTSVSLLANTQSVTSYYGDSVGPGSPVITAAATGLTSGTQTETIIGSAAKLAFITQPAGAVHPNAFTTQPVVAVEDSSGNIVTNNTSAVTLAIGTNPTSGSTLTCAPVNAVNGVATFAGCKISLAGTGYTLKATDGTLTLVTSISFNVS